MPGVFNQRKLYLATSMTELNQKASIGSLQFDSAEKVMKSAETLYKEAEKSYQDGDEEKAYTYFMKYYELYKILQAKPNWKKASEWLNMTKLHKVLERAEELNTSLSKRYDILKQASEIKAIEIKKLEEFSSETTTVTQNEKQVIAKNDEPEIMKNKCGENKSTLLQWLTARSKRYIIADFLCETSSPEFLSSSKLFSMMQDSLLNLLILDVRSSSDFEVSHIKQDYAINIPEEILTPGITAAGLEKKLSLKIIPLWKKRSEVDFVIMLDWNTSTSSEKGTYLNTLKDAVCKWDMDTLLKSDPLILDGGYDDWLLHYPMYTSDGGYINVTRQEHIKKNLTDASSLLIEYPNLDDAFLASPDEKDTNSLPNSSSLSFAENVEHKNGWDTKDERISRSVIKSAPTIDRSTKPKVEILLDKLSRKDVKPFLDLNFDNSETSKEGKSEIPLVDRSSKPPFDTFPPKSVKEELSKGKISDHNSLDIQSEENANNELLMKEKFEKSRLQKELEIEESMRLMVQEKEEFLHGQIKALKDENRLLEEEKKKLKESIKMKELHDQKQDEQEKISETHRPQDTEGRKKEGEETQWVSGNEKHEKDKRKSEDKVSNKFVDSHNKEISRLVPGKEVSSYLSDTRSSSEKIDEYTLPLKNSYSAVDMSKRGLTRSHSSPNIAQMVEEEETASLIRVPQFDRSLKPIKKTPQSPLYSRGYKYEEIGPARLRNLNPVYGCQGCGITGLKNLGNTCFMNSIIQSLAGTTPLAVYFTSGIFRADINRENKQGTRGEVAEEFAVIIRAMWMGHYRSISPKDFKNVVSRHLAVCVGHEQQDSHEFLVVLMEKLHADLNQAKTNRPLKMPDLENIPDYVAAVKFWDYHSQLNQSIIKELFEGLLQSTLTCLNCKKTSSSYEVFSCLSLPIPSTSRCTLKECIQLFLKSEKMSGEGAWDCPQCKHRQEAEKKMVICRLPKILIIHLKRFSYEGMWRRKLQTFVHFPVLDLEMSPFASLKQISSPYQLYGVVNHYGTLEGGHYTAYCKNSAYEKWFKYDDHEVSDMSHEDVKTAAAYILFYSSIDLQACLTSSV